MSPEALRRELRDLVTSSYLVNEKIPTRGYQRMWSLFVRFKDGTSEKYLGDDSDAGCVDVHRRAIRDAKQRMAP